MMKSFFKKLAFVMALAMVVSLAAPAGVSALAAENVLRVVDEADNTVVTEITLEEVGDTCNLKYWDYKGTGDKAWNMVPNVWASDNEEVATVVSGGIVTAVAEGTANITITVGDYVGTVKVTVGEVEAEEVVTPPAEEPKEEEPEEEELAIEEVVQVNHNTFKVVFNQNVNYKREDVKLVKFYGDYPINNWPISFFNCKDNEVTVRIYGEFADGEAYEIKIGDFVEPFVAEIGAITNIEVTWKSTGVDGVEKAGVAFAVLDDDADPIPVYLSYKLWSGDVEVTNAKKYAGGKIYYEVSEEHYMGAMEEAFDKIEVDDDVLEFEDYTAGVAFIIASYDYEDAEGEDVTFTNENVTPIEATPVPAFSLEEVVEWTVVKKNDTKIDWTKPVHSFRAFDDATANNYYLAALLKDSLGNYYVFPSLDETNVTDNKYNNKAVLDFDDIGDTDDSAKDFELAFTSTNNNALFVGSEDGLLVSICAENTAVILTLFDDEVEVGHLTAFDVNVKEERKIDDIIITADAVKKLPFAANDATFTKGDVTFKVVDQDDQPIAATGLTITTSENANGFTEKTLVATSTGLGTFKVTVDGSKYYEVDKKDSSKHEVIDSVKYTVKVNGTTVTGSFTVGVEEPEYDDEVIEIEEYKISKTDINQTIADSSKYGDVAKTFTVHQYSNDLKVGVAGAGDEEITLVTKGSALLKDDKVLTVASGAAQAKGELFVVVYDKDGVAVPGTIVSGADGVYTFTAAGTETKTVNGDDITVMKYEATGNYKIVVYSTKKLDRTGDYWILDEETDATLVVSRNNPAVTFDTANGQEKVDLTGENNLTIDALLTKAFNFKFNTADLKETEAYFTNIKYKYNESAGRVFVYSVDVYAPLDNDDDAKFFNAGTVAINKYVEVNNTFDAE